jgi:hypothetical protein
VVYHRTEEERIAAEAAAAEARIARAKELKVKRREARPDEVGTLVDICRTNKDVLLSKREAEQERTEWEAYLACSAVPDAADVKGVNTLVLHFFTKRFGFRCQPCITKSTPTNPHAAECFVHTQPLVSSQR